jgi:membrane-associated HD superfamily phosphohydrolase
MALGAILQVQNITQNYESWVYVWPILFAGVGAGFILFCTGKEDKRLAWLGKSWLVFGFCFLVLCYSLFRIDPQSFHWTMVLVGSGLFFILPGLNKTFRKFFIPGFILTGLGLILSYQRISGDWTSWSYVWALIPGLTGLGILASAGKNQKVVLAGGIILWISTISFLVFAVCFAHAWQVYRYWPVLLILLGLFQLTKVNFQVEKPIQLSILAKNEVTRS